MPELAAPVQTEIEIRKSRFIGMVLPVSTRDEARQRLQEIRAQWPGATHYCWVLLCEGASGFDDDGEPSGTAAKPMYNVLMHKGLNNVLGVVVRYYGGIKLGAGGLVRAYGQAISEALKHATLVQAEPTVERTYRVAFAAESALRRLCEKSGAQVLEVGYGEAVTLRVRLKSAELEAFEMSARQMLGGALEVVDDA
ncbi:MAG: YigZ family protein [Burkholderiales bacterium]|nr:YigZ family protein [Burkholderiales bacterium]